MNLTVIAAAFLCASSALAQTPSTDPWKPLRFLIGTWEGKTQAAGSGDYSFQLELRDHILARHASAAGAAHEDLLYVYQDAPDQAYKAIYFDNEGHVIHYDVSFPDPASVVFLSAQFRLSYELKGSTMHGKFQIRAPGQAEYKPYLEWSGSKR